MSGNNPPSQPAKVRLIIARVARSVALGKSRHVVGRLQDLERSLQDRLTPGADAVSREQCLSPADYSVELSCALYHPLMVASRVRGHSPKPQQHVVRA